MDSDCITGPVLVVGGCGFLGHHIVNELLANSTGTHSVAVLDVTTHRNRHPRATYHTADISRRDEVAKVFEEVKPQVVFHTASPSPFSADGALFEKINVVGTQNLVECAKDVGTVRAFVYTASSSIVDNHRGPLVEATEDLPVLFYPEQPEMYSHSKALAEAIVLKANRANENGMCTASIRPAAVYGAGDAGITTNVTKQALSGRAKYRFGTAPYLFDTVYVENCTYAHRLLAHALVKAADAAPLSPATRVEAEAFFVSNDERIPFWDLQRLVAELVGRPVKDKDVSCIPVWLILTIAVLSEWVYWVCSRGRKQPVVTTWVVRLTTRERTVCIDKVKERLGYRPKFTNREGWARALEWAVPRLGSSKQEKRA